MDACTCAGDASCHGWLELERDDLPPLRGRSASGSAHVHCVPYRPPCATHTTPYSPSFVHPGPLHCPPNPSPLFPCDPTPTMAEFQNSRACHKVTLRRVGFDVSLDHAGAESMRAMRIHDSDSDEVVPDSEEERLQ